MSEFAIEKILWMDRGRGIGAQGQIPAHSEIFRDHFPAFPVLPGVLALEMLKATAEYYLREGDKTPEKYFLKRIHGAKFHTYLKPGDVWESRLQLVSTKEGETCWKAELFHQGKLAVSAELILARVPLVESQSVNQGG